MNQTPHTKREIKGRKWIRVSRSLTNSSRSIVASEPLPFGSARRKLDQPSLCHWSAPASWEVWRLSHWVRPLGPTWTWPWICCCWTMMVEKIFTGVDAVARLIGFSQMAQRPIARAGRAKLLSTYGHLRRQNAPVVATVLPKSPARATNSGRDGE